MPGSLLNGKETLLAIGCKVTLFLEKKVPISYRPNRGKERDRFFIKKGRLQGGKWG